MIIGIDASRAALANRTGTETYAFEVIRALATHADADHLLRLYTPRPPAGTWISSPFVETRVIPLPRLWTHLRLAAEIAQNPPDVLFVPSHVLPLISTVPAVVTVHDLGYLHFPETHTRFQRWYLNFTTRRHTRIARRIIADSAATKNDLVRFYRAPAEKIHVVHLGISTTIHRVENPAATVKKYGISGEYLLYLGTLQPRKNLLRLLTAFQKISAEFPGVTLVLAGGKGWLFDQIRQQIDRLQLDERVVLPGFIPEADKSALLSGATAYLFPSLYEGFGLPVLEAMACGTPVLIGNGSSLPEIAGDAALAVNPLDSAAIADGIRRLLTDPALRQSLVSKGFRRVRQFSWEKTGAEIWQILLEAAS